VWEILILNLIQIRGTVYGNKYAVQSMATNTRYSLWQQIYHVTGGCYELPRYTEVNMNSIKSLKKKEDCSTPSGLRRNEPDRSFLAGPRQRSCIRALSRGQKQKRVGSNLLVRKLA